ncbi:yjeF C-terminal region, hydroxyethylthiazole kinase-related/yjeF N-terminal region [Tessaracoccus bendigoensis DSM 12906]|uniref:ADP-dependent (S)-NAD(P)H-hydrate dehydratase n=1 Tax=Tessaracoccus bendigoensis DSM 12906 TaxID=1123357 RepID=A0A1M6EWV3_9ACTN|nr:NAD(P)H-hydrate epimerase [Tessaracoccus bendigoensis]SHI89918.1 yjeF C-terminal region, hydroxyethylthiazole kinase-related/yjeF N-terminal region [Tessaracoccus bendigoensis DSM 12906]
MRQILTSAQLRAAERHIFDTRPDVDLMSLAAREVARVTDLVEPTGKVIVAVGPGNNGGDGLFAAALLAEHRPVLLWLVNGRAHEEGLIAAVVAGAQEVDAVSAIGALADCAVVIDAFTGLGSRPGLPPQVATFAAACEAQAVQVVAVDLPSGLDADLGRVSTSFQATHTVTFAAPKPCHVQQPAAARCGRIHIADIGLDIQETNQRIAEEADIAGWWPSPDEGSDKYSRGVVTLDTGSESYPGAALLSCAGALHAGAGMVRYTGRAPSGLILSRFPSVVIGDGRAEATVLGSGWGDTDNAASRVEWAKLHNLPAVVDADALYSLPRGRLDGWLLTPHAGELARLLGCTRAHVEAEPLACVREVSRTSGAAVLLKGATQYVAEPSGRVTLAVRGPAWTARAGSGDVLAGICGALLAAGLPAWKAGVMGASIQAITAGRNPGPYTPDELSARMPSTIAELVGQPSSVSPT